MEWCDASAAKHLQASTPHRTRLGAFTTSRQYSPMLVLQAQRIGFGERVGLSLLRLVKRLDECVDVCCLSDTIIQSDELDSCQVRCTCTSKILPDHERLLSQRDRLITSPHKTERFAQRAEHAAVISALLDPFTRMLTRKRLGVLELFYF